VKTSGQAKVENSAYYGGDGSFETGVHDKVALPMNMTWAYAFQPTPKPTMRQISPGPIGQPMSVFISSSIQQRARQITLF